MKEIKDANIKTLQEVNLKSFLKKVYKNKFVYLASICTFLIIAIAYISLATPKYEVSSSLLIDPSGSNRILGENKYVEGGVSLIEMEKNLFNEVGILKSFSLLQQTVEDLNLDVSYYTGKWPMKKEHYGFFPFEVSVTRDKPQLYGIPFEVRILSNNKYRLTINCSDFTISNPTNGSTREVANDFSFSKDLKFGELVSHDYFTFVLEKPEYKVSANDFRGDDLSFTVYDPASVTESYVSKLEVNNIDIQASIFNISSTGTLVHKEVDFLKKLVENYIQNKLESRNDIASDKETFIRKQLAEISDSLAKVEFKLELYKRDKRALNLEATATNALGRTSNLQVEKTKIEFDIEYYKSLSENIKTNRNSDDFMIPTAVGIEDPLINENILELKTLYAERTKKKFFVTSTNQEMAILNKQIRESTDLLLSNLRNAVKSSEMVLQRINSQLSSYDGVINSLPTRENELLDIERQSTLYENLFNYLSQELAKAGIARAESISDTRVLDEARMVGDGPVAPQKTLILALALVVGTLIPLAWMVLFTSKETIENVDQIEEHSTIPVIASIVHYNSKSKKNGSNLSLWKVKESFRDLSTTLKQKSSREQKVLGITSIMPKEGKTYNAINLGITLAEAGNKTLIIDGDLRNPSLVKRVSKIEGRGLSDYLQGDVRRFKDIIYPHETLDNLKFIPTTVVKGNVHQLLSSFKLATLIHELREKFDYIIIDTPPVGIVSDFLLFGEAIDINLYVVRRKVAKLAFLGHLEKLIQDNKKDNSYIVFNDALEQEHKYGYGLQYGKNIEKQLVKDYLSV